jgi:tetratricopeptide (TPR) repeat protein
MLFRFRSHAVIHTLAVSLILFASLSIRAQATTHDEGDPVKLFELGQDAHARRDYQQALKLYEEALKLKAEYQRGMALATLDRVVEAEKALRRAVELRPDWALAQSALGTLLLMHTRQVAEGEKLLGQALAREGRLPTGLVYMASNAHWRAEASRDALQALLRLLRGVTEGQMATTDDWTARGRIEGDLGENPEALASFERALSIDSQNFTALSARAGLRAKMKDYEKALADAQAASRLAPLDAALKLQVIDIYLRAGKREEARRAWDALPAETKQLPEAVALGNAMLSCDDTPENRAALEKILADTPRDTSLLACLGAAYRRADPARSLEFYRRAAEVEPRNVELATGYAAALVQARRFDEAVIITRRVLAIAPDKYEARANLATALYELKRYPEALVEFRLLAEAKPSLAATYFFIATAHDYLGEYPAALTAYETFLARADAQNNQLEIEKVNLRLPSLRNQIKRGEGAKKKGTSNVNR